MTLVVITHWVFFFKVKIIVKKLTVFLNYVSFPLEVVVFEKNISKPLGIIFVHRIVRLLISES